MTLRELLSGAAGTLPDTSVSAEPDGTLRWARLGRVFAVLGSDGSAAEFALDTSIAAAAVRTPDATASGRGPGWVRFAPVTLEDHAIDRATAWFASAYRRA